MKYVYLKCKGDTFTGITEWIAKIDETEKPYQYLYKERGIWKRAENKLGKDYWGNEKYLTWIGKIKRGNIHYIGTLYNNEEELLKNHFEMLLQI